MPVHDWGPVRAGWFHHFHNSWIYKLSDRLNAGLLPAGFYAAGEEVVQKQDRVVIRTSEGSRIVALIEIVSRGNKQSRHELERFLRKVASALESKYHLLIIDLHPPGSFDPQGIHGTIWDYLFGSAPCAPGDRPLTLVSYCALPVRTAYVEPVAVGASLPDMPLFLDASWYVNVPLEETYLQTWSGVPEPWKREMQG